MKVVSLFSGCGGLDLGFEKAGFEVVWANEFDTAIHQTYRLNHPKTELNTSDIRNLSFRDIPDCDGIIGGPPCQSWSLGGKSLGLEDDRGKLVFDYIRIVKEKRPKFFVMENVPGMVSLKHFQSFNEFLDLFRNAGYITKYELINAADFKIPQDRVRVIIVGIRNDLNVEYVFPTKLGSPPITLLKAIGDLKEAPIPYNNELVCLQSAPIPNHDYFTGPFDNKYMARNRVRSWNELSFTIQAQAKNEPIHPQAPKMEYVSDNKRKFVAGKEFLYRRLSVRECARIQTFPDNFMFIYNRVHDGYKMVGNAVPPRLAYYLALSINSCFLSSSHITEYSLVLIGYVKSELDFSIIRKELVYYIRGGKRPGSMQYGQLTKPIKWLMLHHKNEREVYELSSCNVENCTKEYLKRLGFSPHGDEYWLFKLKRRVIDNDLISSIIKQSDEMTRYPKIVIVRKKTE